jgi:hypothetical protein
MSKRIKKVFSSSSQVIHLWANQSQSDARCRNVFFEGLSIYSYGRHYELGRFIDYNGHKVAMINSRGYSVTTRGHISDAYHAVEGLRLRCPTGNLTDVEGALLANQSQLIDDIMAPLSRMKFYSESYANEHLTSTIMAHNNICNKLGHSELALELPQDLTDLIQEHVTERIARQLKLQSPEMLALRAAKLIKKQADVIAKWRSSDLSSLNYNIKFKLPIMLRIRGEMVETSQGAQVPLREAIILLKMVNSGRDVKGLTVGSFTVINKTDDIIKIGCHTIPISEANHILGAILEQGAAK